MIRVLLLATALLIVGAGCDKTIHEVRHNPSDDTAVALHRPAPDAQP